MRDLFLLKIFQKSCFFGDELKIKIAILADYFRLKQKGQQYLQVFKFEYPIVKNYPIIFDEFVSFCVKILYIVFLTFFLFF